MNPTILLDLKFNDIIILLVIVIDIFIAFFILSRDNKKISNILFFLFLCSLVSWLFTNILLDRLLDKDINIFLAKLTACFSLNSVVSFLLFNLYFPHKNKILNKLVFYAILTSTIVINIICLLTNYIVINTDTSALPIKVIHGVYFPLFVFILCILILLSMMVLLRNVFILSGREKKQSLYLLIGSLFSFLLAIITNAILPIWGEYSLTPIGHLATLFMAVAVGYTIIVHRMWGIGYLISNTVTYFILSAFIFGTSVIISIINGYVFGSIYTPGSILIGIILTSLFAKYFYLIKRKSRELSSFLVRTKTIESADIKEYIDKTFSSHLALSETKADLIYMFEKFFYIKEVSIYIPQYDESKVLTPIYNRYPTNTLVLDRETTSIEPILLDFMKINNYMAVIPLTVKNNLIALVFLGTKSNNDVYNKEDIDNFEIIKDTLAMGIKKSILYEESQLYAHILQKKVDEATVELRKQKELVEEKYQTERDMMGIMGHELRTPLTTARGFLEIVISKMKNDPDQSAKNLEHYIDMVYGGFKREIDLVQTMLSTSHVDNNKLKLDLVEVDLDSIIKGSIMDFTPEAAKKKLILEYHPIDNIPTVKCDPSRTIEITNNLISNAIKYTHVGRVDVYTSYDDEWVYFSVKDTGEGIAENEIPNIGKKFYRIQNYLTQDKSIMRPGGTGLGMYIVKAILSACGGALRIESKVGVGSTFTAVFPRWKEQ